MKPSIRVWVLGVAVVIGVSVAAVTAIGQTPGTGTQNNVLSEAIAVEQGAVERDPHQAVVSGGVVNTALDFTNAFEQRADRTGKKGHDRKDKSFKGTQGCQNVFKGHVDNVRVNQDCSLRRQAEEVVAVDPNNPDHLSLGRTTPASATTTAGTTGRSTVASPGETRFRPSTRSSWRRAHG